MFLFWTAAYAADQKNLSPCDIAYPSDDTIEWECYTLKRKEDLESLFGDRWQDVARFNRIDRRHALPGTRLKVPERFEDIEDFTPLPSELEYPSAAEDKKFILIDL